MPHLDARKTGDPHGAYYMPAMSDAPLRGNGGHDWFWEPDREHIIYPLENLVEMYYNSERSFFAHVEHRALLGCRGPEVTKKMNIRIHRKNDLSGALRIAHCLISDLMEKSKLTKSIQWNSGHLHSMGPRYRHRFSPAVHLRLYLGGSRERLHC